MKHRMKAIIEFEIDTDTKKLTFIYGAISEPARNYFATTYSKHFENFSLALQINGISPQELAATFNPSIKHVKKPYLAAQTFETCGITFEQLMSCYREMRA